ncbi:hypothetical protein BH24ACT21_BH24ACT21_11030 [soil metagenome]|jgi:protein-S-isoprenylcysteine O-methyltransferase Ste14
MKFSTIVLGPLTAWVLRKARRDYETHGQLSTKASTGAWMLYLIHLFTTLAASWRSTQLLPLPGKPSIALGGLLTLSGVSFFVAAVREFRSFKQMSGTETGNLVTSGPYRYSRNPQVVGWGLALLGTSIAGRSPKALLLTTAFFLTHRLYFVSEEQHLERIFGEEYRRYRSKTPRFLGFPDE